GDGRPLAPDPDCETDCWNLGATRLPRPPYPGQECGDENDSGKIDYVIMAVPPRRLAKVLFPKSSAVVEDIRRAHFPILDWSSLWRLWIFLFVLPLPGPPPGAEVGLAFGPLLKLRSEPMASLDVHFTRRLPGVPREHTVLMGSRYDLSFIDNSQ